MGNALFAPTEEAFDYDGALMKDRVVRSVEVKSEEMEECGPVHRNAKFPDELVRHPPVEAGEEPCLTVFSAFERGVRKWPEGKCLGLRPGKKGAFEWLTYAQVMDDVRALGSGLAALGLQAGDSVGICSANRIEWTETMLAAYSQTLRVVALYDTLGLDAVEYILNHSESKVAFVSKEKLPIVMRSLPKLPNLKTVVQFDVNPRFRNEGDAVEQKERDAAAARGVKLLGLSELLADGRAANQAPRPPKGDDLCMLMYTSGTTGVPKAVMLTHGNLMAFVGGAAKSLLQLSHDDSYLSFLPLAHIFESAVQTTLFYFGCAIGFFSGDIKMLADDIKTLEPTVFAGVPRVYTRFYDRFMASIAGMFFIKRNIVLNSFARQCRNLRHRQPFEPYAESIMLKVRTAMGLHRCRVMVTGAAPMPPYIMEFLRVAINPKLGVLQGYGMTETAAGVAASESDDLTMGHVGGPMPSAEIRLRDVPEMGYMTANNPPTGEVLARGPSIFQGYYKNPEATAETLLPGGWIATGDVGRWNPNGSLSIIDRKKNLFKLAHGEYVAAEKLELAYARAKLVGQIFVYGNSYKPFLVAVVVPGFDKLQPFATEKGWWTDKNSAPLSEPFRAHFRKVVEEHREEIRQVILKGIEEEAKKEKFQGFEGIKDVHVVSEIDDLGMGFTVANDCMTPTFKLRRPFILRRFKEEIKQLYSRNGEAPKPDEKW